MLSIRGTDFIACWAYEERISAHAQPAVKCDHFHMYNPCWAYEEQIYRTLSILETNFIACWAYAEPISSHAEHVRKCLKVEYLGQIEYDFQKSCVTGPWDHKVSVSAKKIKKMSCLCTLNIGQLQVSAGVPLWTNNALAASISSFIVVKIYSAFDKWGLTN